MDFFDLYGKACFGITFFVLSLTFMTHFLKWSWAEPAAVARRILEVLHLACRTSAIAHLVLGIVGFVYASQLPILDTTKNETTLLAAACLWIMTCLFWASHRLSIVIREFDPEAAV